MGRKRKNPPVETRRKKNAVVGNVFENCELETDELLDYEHDELNNISVRSDIDDDCEINEFRRKLNQTSNTLNNVHNVSIISQHSKVSNSSHRDEMLPFSTSNSTQHEYLSPQVNGKSKLLDSSDDESTEPLTAEQENTLLESEDENRTSSEENSLLESEDENKAFSEESDEEDIRSIGKKSDRVYTSSSSDESSENERRSYRKQSYRSEKDTSSEKSDEDIDRRNESNVGESAVLPIPVVRVCGGIRTVTGQNDPETNLKRPTNCISQFNSKSKRTKWKESFRNSYETTQIHLNDLGYESPEEQQQQLRFDITDSANVENQNTAQSTFRVIMNRDKPNRLFRKIVNPTSVCVTGNSKADSIEDSFKIPLLPPSKRPPTRIKRVEEIAKAPVTRTISNFGSNSTISISSHNIDDDVISIAASSTWCTIEEQPAAPEPVKDETNDIDERLSGPFDEYDRVETWIRDIQPPPPPPVPQETVPVSSQSSVPDPVPDFLVSSIPIDPIVNSANPVNARVQFKTVPQFFQGLCYFYYVNQNCSSYNRCSLVHAVSFPKFAAKAERFTPVRLLEAYNFMVQHRLKTLYSEVYLCFIKGFTFHKMKNELISCINDFYTFEVPIMDSVDMVVEGLEKMGLSFSEAIENIVFLVGLRLPDFGNILLDLMTAKTQISENWNMIKKLIQTIGRISPNMAKKIFHSATHVYPLDRKLLLDINEVIIKNNITDLSQISQDDLMPFKCLEGFKDNTTSRSPITQTVIRLPVTKNNVTGGLRQSEKIRQIPKLTDNPQNQITNNISKPDRIQIRRHYDFSTGRVTASCSSSSSTNSDDRPMGSRSMERLNSLSTFSLNNQELISSSKNQYVPQHIVRENRQKNYSQNNHYVSQPEYKISPSIPVVGQTRPPENYIIEQSLHYLYPEVIRHQVDLDEPDLFVLKQAVYEMNAEYFLRLLEKYNEPATLTNFIILTIVYVKDNLQDAANTLRILLTNMGVEYLEVHTKKMIKVIFEVIVMNLLVEMEKICYWKGAVQLLEHFTDWDSLVTSQMVGSRRLTHMGKYIYLARLLCKGKNFYYAHRILMCPELRLMNAPSTWPFFYCQNFDLQFRNEVLNEFLSEGHNTFLLGPLNMHRYMLTSADVYGYNRRQQQEYLNIMLKSILESGKSSSLKCCFTYLSCFYKILDKSILRSLASAVVERLSKDEKVQLYEFCCRREIYQPYSGEETTIVIKTDNSDNEIFLIFSYFFYKKSKVPSPLSTDLYIDIRVPQIGGSYTKMLKSVIRSAVQINVAVKNVLRENFNMLVRDSPNSTFVVIPAPEVTTVLLEQYDWNPML